RLPAFPRSTPRARATRTSDGCPIGRPDRVGGWQLPRTARHHPSAPPSPPPPPRPPPPAPPPPPDPRYIVDTVVCAAAEAIQLMPEAIRPALRAAFRRARLAGLSVQDVDKALHGGEGPDQESRPDGPARTKRGVR